MHSGIAQKLADNVGIGKNMCHNINRSSLGPMRHAADDVTSGQPHGPGTPAAEVIYGARIPFFIREHYRPPPVPTHMRGIFAKLLGPESDGAFLAVSAKSKGRFIFHPGR